MRIARFPYPRLPGDYEVTLRLPDDSRTLKFSIASPAAPFGAITQFGAASAPTRRGPHGPVGTTFDASDRVVPVFTLTSDAGIDYDPDFIDAYNPFVVTWRYGGVDVYTNGQSYRDDQSFYGNSAERSGVLPAGDYQISVLDLLTGEMKLTTFTVVDTGPPPTPTATPTRTATPAPTRTPTPPPATATVAIPTPTSVAPLPPATGTGAVRGSEARWAVVLGIVLLVLGGGLLALRRRG